MSLEEKVEKLTLTLDRLITAIEGPAAIPQPATSPAANVPQPPAAPVGSPAVPPPPPTDLTVTSKETPAVSKETPTVRKISASRAGKINDLMVQTVKNLGDKMPVIEAMQAVGVSKPTDLTKDQADELVKKLEAM